MIRYATKEDIPALKALWQQAFCDEESFLEAFFEKRVEGRFHQVILLEEEGVLISMLYALPCTLVHGPSGSSYPAVNIVGVATDASRRHQGHMTRLLQESFSMLKAVGMEAAVLKPSNPNFYAQYGFTICNTLYQVEIPQQNISVLDPEIVDVPGELSRLTSQYPTEGYKILKSREDWEFQLSEPCIVGRFRDGYAICESERDPKTGNYTAFETVPSVKGTPYGYTMYKKIGDAPELPEDIGRENLIFEWY